MKIVIDGTPYGTDRIWVKELPVDVELIEEWRIFKSAMDWVSIWGGEDKISHDAAGNILHISWEFSKENSMAATKLAAKFSAYLPKGLSDV